MEYMFRKYVTSIFIISFTFGGVFGITEADVTTFSLPEVTLTVGDSVFIDNTHPTHFYAVFLPFEFPANGDMCASITGEDLAQDNDLRHYGTCFINDPGVFTVVDLGEPVHASYWDTKDSDYFIGEKIVTLVPSVAGQ